MRLTQDSTGWIELWQQCNDGQKNDVTNWDRKGTLSPHLKLLENSRKKSITLSLEIWLRHAIYLPYWKCIWLSFFFSFWIGLNKMCVALGSVPNWQTSSPQTKKTWSKLNQQCSPYSCRTAKILHEAVSCRKSPRIHWWDEQIYGENITHSLKLQKQAHKF